MAEDEFKVQPLTAQKGVNPFTDAIKVSDGLIINPDIPTVSAGRPSSSSSSSLIVLGPPIGDDDIIILSSSSSSIRRPIGNIPEPFSSSSSSSSVFRGPVSIAASVPQTGVSSVPIDVIAEGAIAATGSNISDLVVSRLVASSQNVVSQTNVSTSRLSQKSGIISSQLRKLDFVNIFYNRGFPSDATHAELFFPEKESNPKFTISAKSLPESIKLDIISFSDVPVEFDSKKFSGNFVLAQNPFSVFISSGVSQNLKLKFEKDVLKFIDFNRNKTILNIKLQDIYKHVGRIFPFDLKLNFVDASVQSIGDDLDFNVINIDLNNSAIQTFDGLSVGVQKNNQGVSGSFFYIKETYRFIAETLLSIQGAEFNDCNNTARNLKFSDSKTETQDGILTSVSLHASFEEKIPYAFPLFYVDDRSDLNFISPSIKYKGSKFALHTEIKHTNYNISNQMFFYDQSINRFLASVENDGSLYTRHHSIFQIKDILKSLKFDHPVSPSGSYVVNNMEFRREYNPDEIVDDREKNDFDANYFFYINATEASASNQIVPIGDFEINGKIKDQIKCEIGYFIEADGKKIKDNFNIKIYATTSVGSPSSPRVFSRSLILKWSSSPAFKYGKYLTYGSGKSKENGYELQSFSIKDLIDIFDINIAGNINEDFPNGESSSICNGLFPSLKEIFPFEYSSDEPCVSFRKNPNYSGFYLMPLSRIWLGNSDGSKIIAKNELSSISISNESPKNLSKSIFSMGLEKSVDLTGLCLAFPLNRKVGRLKVRHAVKSFDDHVKDNDFNSKLKGGKSDSRFYNFNTVFDSISILREGYSYFNATRSRPSSEMPYYYGRISGNKQSSYGASKKLIGLANLGVCTPISSQDPINGDIFHKTCPSYVMSGLSSDDPKNISTISISKKINDISSVSGDLHIVYKNGDMFPVKNNSFEPNPSYMSDFGSSQFYPNGGDFAGSNVSIFLSTGSDDGYTSSSERISREYEIGSSNLLSLSIHGSEKNCIIEGGELSDGIRNVGVSACYDTGSLRKGMIPDSDFIKNELISLAAASGNVNGNISSGYVSKTNGKCLINGTGTLKNNFTITISPKSISLKDINNKLVFYNNQIRHFVEILQNELGDRFNIKISSDRTLNDPISPEMLNVEYRYLSPFIISSSSTSSIDFRPPEIDEYDVYNAYDSYYNSSYSEIDPYRYILSYKDPYSFFDVYNPYDEYDLRPTPEEVKKNFRDMRFSNINERQIVSLKVLTKKPINRVYKFPLKQGFAYSLADLILDFNKSMSSFGISAKSLVSNPGRFLASKLHESEKPLLDTSIRYVSSEIEIEEEIKKEKETDPYSYDPYATDPYSEFTTFVKIERTKQKEKTIYDPLIEGSVQAAVEADSVYSAVIKIDPFGNSSGISPYSDKTRPYESSVFLTRPRYEPTVSLLLSSQANQSSLAPLNVPQNDSTVLIPKFFERNKLESFEGDQESDTYEFNTQKIQQAFVLSQPEIGGMQIAYAGNITDGKYNINSAPNTYFESGNNIYGDIEFNSKESDQAILSVRMRLISSPYLYPESGNSAQYDDFYSNIVCRVEYSNGESIEVLSPAEVSDIDPESLVQEEVNQDGETVFIKPAVFKIPLKSLISYITFYLYQGTNIVSSSFVKILNSPIELDQFGFLAINNTNPRYSMTSSKVSKTFGLVLDNIGSWDILISPEASLSRTTFGDFDLPNGSSYFRQVFDTEERFIVGIGTPIINQASGDITGFDTSGIPSVILENISLLPVPNYQQVWILKIQSGLKSFLRSLRASADPKSLEGCYVDIPVFAKGMVSGSEGSANIRIFTETSCVFDYSFCEFFWNLGSPINAPGAFRITNTINVRYEELVDCGNIAERVSGTNQIKIFNYSIVNIENIPSLDNGTGLLILKTDANVSYLNRVFWPSQDQLSTLKKIPVVQSNDETPWEYDCSLLNNQEKNNSNKTILFTDPTDLNIFETNLVTINSLVKTLNSYLLIQPRINFPPEDDGEKNYENEKVIGSVGFVFKNWRSSVDSIPLFGYKMIFGFESLLESSDTNVDVFIPITYKYYYNEDRLIK